MGGWRSGRLEILWSGREVSLVVARTLREMKGGNGAMGETNLSVGGEALYGYVWESWMRCLIL